MATKTAKTLRMVFTTEAGKAVTLSLADPRDDVTRADTTDFMTNVIAKNAFAHKNGKVASVKDVKLRTVEESDLA